jgi:hypothetical protein
VTLRARTRITIGFVQGRLLALVALVAALAASSASAATTERLSVSTAGEQAVSDAYGYSVSRTGRFVVFDSDSYNLVPNDGNPSADTFIRDRDTDRDGIFDEPGKVRTVRLSVSPSGADQIGSSLYETSISASGRHVVFVSNAINLVSGDQSFTASIFVRDRDTDGDRIFDEPDAVKTVRVSESSAGVPATLRSAAKAPQSRPTAGLSHSSVHPPTW